MQIKKRPKIIILDQWASNLDQKGTSKNWLYQEFEKHFQIEIKNADAGLYKSLEMIQCLARAILFNPFNYRKEYYRNIECNSKYPRVFENRTVRFRRLIEKIELNYDAIFQIGCLFGPISVDNIPSFSIHDQTVSILEREWPEWLPRDFKKYKGELYDLEKRSLQSKARIFTYSKYTRKSIIKDYEINPYLVKVTPTLVKNYFLTRILFH